MADQRRDPEVGTSSSIARLGYRLYLFVLFVQIFGAIAVGTCALAFRQPIPNRWIIGVALVALALQILSRILILLVPREVNARLYFSISLIADLVSLPAVATLGYIANERGPHHASTFITLVVIAAVFSYISHWAFLQGTISVSDYTGSNTIFTRSVWAMRALYLSATVGILRFTWTLCILESLNAQGALPAPSVAIALMGIIALLAHFTLLITLAILSDVVQKRL